MKLFSVSAVWHKKYERKDWIKTAIIMAESREEAIKKYKFSVSYPENARVDATEWKDGIYTLNAKKMI